MASFFKHPAVFLAAFGILRLLWPFVAKTFIDMSGKLQISYGVAVAVIFLPLPFHIGFRYCRCCGKKTAVNKRKKKKKKKNTKRRRRQYSTSSVNERDAARDLKGIHLASKFIIFLIAILEAAQLILFFCAGPYVPAPIMITAMQFIAVFSLFPLQCLREKPKVHWLLLLGLILLVVAGILHVVGLQDQHLPTLSTILLIAAFAIGGAAVKTKDLLLAYKAYDLEHIALVSQVFQFMLSILFIPLSLHIQGNMPEKWSLESVGEHFANAFSCVFAMQEPNWSFDMGNSSYVPIIPNIQPGSPTCEPWGIILLVWFAICTYGSVFCLGKGLSLGTSPLLYLRVDAFIAIASYFTMYIYQDKTPCPYPNPDFDFSEWPHIVAMCLVIVALLLFRLKEEPHEHLAAGSPLPPTGQGSLDIESSFLKQEKEPEPRYEPPTVQHPELSAKTAKKGEEEIVFHQGANQTQEEEQQLLASSVEDGAEHKGGAAEHRRQPELVVSVVGPGGIASPRSTARAATAAAEVYGGGARVLIRGRGVGGSFRSALGKKKKKPSKQKHEPLLEEIKEEG